VKVCEKLAPSASIRVEVVAPLKSMSTVAAKAEKENNEKIIVAIILFIGELLKVCNPALIPLLKSTAVIFRPRLTPSLA
jgi:hypothetical protein